MRKYLIATSALALVACGGGESPEPNGSGQSTPSATTPAPSASETASQTSQAPATPEVLALFGLDGADGQLIQFDASSQDGNVTTFSDVSIDVGGESIGLGTLTLVGAMQDGDNVGFESLTLSNLAIEAPDEAGGLAIGSITIEQPSAALAGLVSSLMADGAEFDPADLTSLDPASISFGQIGIADVALNIADSDVTGAVGLDEFSLNNLNAETLGAFLFKGLNVDVETEGTPVSATLGEFALNGVNRALFQDFLNTVAENVDGGEDELFAALSTSPFLTDIYTKRLDNFTLSDVTADVAGVLVNLDDYSGTYTQTDTGLEIVEELTGMSIAADGEGEFGAQAALGFAMLGYDALNFSSRSKSIANKETDTISSDEYVFEMEDGFTLTGAYEISGIQEYVENAMQVQPELLSGAPPSPELLTDLYRPLKLGGFSLTLDDKGLADKAWQLGAASTNQSVDDLKAQALGSLTLLPLFAPTEQAQAVATQLADAATTFIQTPGDLTISLAPGEPVALGPVMDQFAAVQETGGDPSAAIDELLSALNISITAEAGEEPAE